MWRQSEMAKVSGHRYSYNTCSLVNVERKATATVRYVIAIQAELHILYRADCFTPLRANAQSARMARVRRSGY